MLIEWGCQQMRQSPRGSATERRWHLAALAVAERSEDPQFLVGDLRRGLGVDAGEIINEQTEIRHLSHPRDRFPNEMRFQLAEGIARYRDWPDQAQKAFGALEEDTNAGAEALVRSGHLFIERALYQEAFTRFDRAERISRDPYVLYLANYLRGVGWARQRVPGRAETAWRRAIDILPGAQSASIALAAQLAKQSRSAEARVLIAASVAGDPPKSDPWREYAHGDDRFWPDLIARLRREIKP